MEAFSFCQRPHLAAGTAAPEPPAALLLGVAPAAGCFTSDSPASDALPSLRTAGLPPLMLLPVKPLLELPLLLPAGRQPPSAVGPSAAFSLGLNTGYAVLLDQVGVAASEMNTASGSRCLLVLVMRTGRLASLPMGVRVPACRGQQQRAWPCERRQQVLCKRLCDYL